jgi:molecular chaperone IbpA
MRTYDFSPMFRHSVGFDRMQRVLDAATTRSEVSYPPYNIETDGEDAYRVTVAVAGFGENDLDVTLENETLTISGKKADEAEGATYLHRGLAGRNFQLRFNLADHIKVNGANLVNGELVVDLEREVPEALKPRKIEIETHPINELAAKAKKLVGIEDKKAA